MTELTKHSKYSTKKRSKGLSKKRSKGLSKKRNNNNFKLCRNKKCADTRIILDVNKTYDYPQENNTLYFFYEIENKIILKIDNIDIYDKIKNKKGFLFYLNFRHVSDDITKKNNTISVDVSAFSKYIIKKIDAETLELSGITKEYPYGFGMVKTYDSKYFKGLVYKYNEKLDNDKYEEYKKNIISKLKHIKFNPNEYYISTYSNLLNKYYYKCKDSYSNVFNIIEYA
tara:strand:- start:3924 stop:4604 length:681 start_codon:yes stop_codon:yes gene_type:complete